MMRMFFNTITSFVRVADATAGMHLLAALGTGELALNYLSDAAG